MEPLGLMALETFLNEKLKDKIEINIGKSLIDFDSFKELCDFIVEFKPDLIGIRAMTLQWFFLCEGVAYLRNKEKHRLLQEVQNNSIIPMTFLKIKILIFVQSRTGEFTIT